ncbi:response regulator [Nitrospira lenta]|uniref:Transcriptional regulatory protein DevR (DosR) n=1 Tax=Nitrospira lenta TaxID=1436998 RepID=A0A330L1Y9_9BACT|nr:response regulator transcription factor [Nitrospira lenta]SPP63778.1 Transcriptional regulatory protein DevR (DosR) [Nitrospira lenta]
MKPARTTLLIVDDHEVVRQGLRTLLDLEPDLRVIGEAASAEDAVTQTKSLRPHVVLLDVKLHGGSGIAACRQILATMPATRILMLTSFSDDAIVVDAVQGGAHGYALKDVRTQDLIHAIRTVASGHGYLDPRVAQQTLHWIRDRSHAAPGHATDRLTNLSPQERAILPLLAEGKTNKEIAIDLHLSDKTVKNYLANIFDKLQVRRRTEAVSWYIRTTRASSQHS